MLCKPIVRNLDFCDVCFYVYICTALYVYVIILCVFVELLQIKFYIFDYSREANILLVETFQKQILSLQKKL